MTISRRLVPPLTSFVGRVDELAAVRSLIAEPSIRIVTLLGPPGVGKTRLALQAARSALPSLSELVIVSLAEAGDWEVAASSVADAFGIVDIGARRPLDLVAEQVRDDAVLLVLDNLERVVDGAWEIAQLVKRCGRLSVLATSRRPLEISPEYCYSVGPLPVAVPNATPDEIRRTDSVSLLTDRLQRIRPDLIVDDSTLAILADISRAVEGLPLALELAAARVRSLPLVTVRDALVECLPILAGGGRDAPARHRTMHDAVAWSYELLDPTAASVFRRLGTCSGGADVLAIASLSADLGLDSAALLDVVAGLVSHNLVVAVDEPQPRFRLLEVVREFAIEALTAASELEAVSRRHAAHYLEVAETSAQHLAGAEQVEWLERMHRDAANFTAAVRFAVGAGDAETALRLCLALRFLWYVRGSLTEGRALFASALALSGAPEPLRARALIEASALARHQADLSAALSLVHEALVIARRLPDPDLSAAVLLQHGFVLHLLGDYSPARQSLEECLALREAQADQLGTALALHHLGLVTYFHDKDVERAWELQLRCLLLLRPLGNERHLATVLVAMGELARCRGEISGATTLLIEAIGHIRRLRDTPLLIYALHYLAAVTYEEGRATHALRLLGAADGLERATGAAAWPTVTALRDQWLARAIRSVGRGRAEAIFDSGRPTGFDEAVALATADPGRLRAGPLTRREDEIARLVAQGLTNRAIAQRLVLSERTVDAHVAHVLTKLEFNNRAQIAAWVADIDGGSGNSRSVPNR